MLAVGKPSELDAAPHIDRIDRGSRKLVQAGMAARDNRGSDERYSAANHVNGNDVEALALVRRKLAEIGAKKVGKRAGGIDAFVPAGEWGALGALDDGRAHDSDSQIAAAPRQHRFAETLGEGVSIWPT